MSYNPSTASNSSPEVQTIREALRCGRAGCPCMRSRGLVHCPTHDDERPSLSVTERDGDILVWCYAGCRQEKVKEALRKRGLWLVSKPTQRKRSEIVATYDYVDEDGRLLFQVVRYHPKTFRQRRPDGNGAWIWSLEGVRRVLYRLPDVLAAAKDGRTIYIVEGEKDADALATFGLAATCNPGGAGKWQDSYSETLRGARVVVLPDNDDAGRQHAEQVARSLYGVAAEVRVLALPGLPPKGDVSDWLQAGGTLEELTRLAAQTPVWTPTLEATEDRDPWQSWHSPDGAYKVAGGQFYMFKGRDKDGERWQRLSNFTARVVEEVVEDDGAEVLRFFVVEGRLRNEHRLTPTTVPAAKFASLTWVHEAWGFGPTIAAGQGARDHLRVAIEAFSEDLAKDGFPRRVMYKHTGWREIDGRWVYLHGGGAIGSNGHIRNVAVSLEGALAGYTLPDPPEGEALQKAIRASLGMVGVAPKRVTVPIYGAIWRAVLGGADFSLHVTGPTGVGKTELAALAQQHFGAGMDARHLPGSWLSTGNSLEVLAFCAKDALLIVDDFAPVGPWNDVARLHREADRLLRAQGNRMGRQRLAADATLKADKPPRGLIVSTGEDVPRGQSLRARFLVIEMSETDMDWDRLAKCQQDAADGLYTQAMSGFLRWLAPQYAAIQAQLRAERGVLAVQVAREGMHRRIPQAVADLGVGLRYFLAFATEAGAITAQERESLWQEWWEALVEVARAQERHHEAADPVRRFLELIGAAIACGEAHLAALDGGEPEAPGSLGWRLAVVGTGEHERSEWRPQGERIGWVDGQNVYLLPDAAFAVAQDLARRQGEPLAVSARTLWKRLHGRGFLVTVGKDAEGTEKLAVRRVCEGVRRYVLHLDAHSIGAPTRKKPDQPDQNAEDPCGVSVSAGPVFPENRTSTQKPDQKPDHEPDHTLRQTTGGGPVRGPVIPGWSGFSKKPDHPEAKPDKPSGQSGPVGPVFCATPHLEEEGKVTNDPLAGLGRKSSSWLFQQECQPSTLAEGRVWELDGPGATPDQECQECQGGAFGILGRSAGVGGSESSSLDQERQETQPSTLGILSHLAQEGGPKPDQGCQESQGGTLGILGNPAGVGEESSFRPDRSGERAHPSQRLPYPVLEVVDPTALENPEVQTLIETFRNVQPDGLPANVRVVRSPSELPETPELAERQETKDRRAVDVTTAPFVGLDLETTGLDPHRDSIRLVTVATQGGVTVIDTRSVPNWREWVASQFHGKVAVLHNAAFDLTFLMAAKCPLPTRVFDTMLAAQLLDGGEHFGQVGYFTLEAVTERFVGVRLSKQLQASDWSGELAPAQFAYATQDAVILLPLARRLQEELMRKNLARASRLEMKALPAITWLIYTGAPFDAERWLRLAEEVEREQAEAAQELETFLGPINPNSPEQVLAALRRVGVLIESTSKRKLAFYREHPVVTALLRYREAAKLASTYGRSFVEKYVNPATGRIHPGYRQIGAATGRMACQKPNLQNIPRDPRFRSCFRPGPGRVFVKADLSQIELVVAACLAEDKRMLQALLDGQDLHTLTAAALYNVSAEQVTKAQRHFAKMVNFGTLYGQGIKGLCEQAAASGLNLTEEQAADMLHRFDQAWPGLAAWRRKQQRQASIWVQTISGRLRNVCELPGTARVNTPVQGSAADCFKKALGILWSTRHECPSAAPVLVVHDELVVEVDEEEAELAARWVKVCLEEGVRSFFPNAPVRVEVVVCADWSGRTHQEGG